MEAIAIIGMGCRFPGAPNSGALWQLLCNGVDAITEVPADRFDVDTFYDPRPATPGKVMSRWGGFLDRVDQFDAAFFGLSPREAARMDPQHRLLLEVAWEAMEDAGQVPEQLAREVAGVFIGIITGDYWDRQFHHPADLDVYSTAGSARSGAAGRISYALGLHGISVALDAACSSSLVAVHLACQSLRTGSCTLALAGGVNIILNPDHTIGFSQGRMMAPDGRCKAFDARADGYVRSEGAGVVVLKPLSRAQADGDPIYALIRGSASNNDGHSELFMAPGVQGQQAVLRQAYRDAGIDPLQVHYVEAHGTGTSVGDPVEITALEGVLCSGRSADDPLLVGSVKTNIGHTEGASGLAGLIKAALCLKYKMIPPNLHFQQPNPAIPWQDHALAIPTCLTPWPQGRGPRVAGVSSFGIAGTNAHVVLEEAPQSEASEAVPEVRDASPATYLLPLSAQTSEALRALARSYLNHLANAENAAQTLHDICYTASLRRTHHDYRLASIARSKKGLQDTLAAFLHHETSSDFCMGQRVPSCKRKLAWIFPGQGSQWLGMGRDLLAQEAVFRDTIEACDRIMRNYVDWSLLDQLRADEAHSRLHEIDVIQPTIFALQIALANLWRSWGIEPDAVIGHSMGEVAAACVAGCISLDDGAWIICSRSRLMRRVSGRGAMAAVELSLEQARQVVSDYADRVSVAVNNSPHSTVLSGDLEALTEILAMLERHNIFGRLVKVDVASHSPQMDPLRDDLLQLIQPVQPQQGTIPMYSTVSGSVIDGDALQADYWFNGLRQPVLFLSATEKLLDDHFGIFLEISPHPILAGPVRQTMEHCGVAGTVLPSLRRDVEGRATLLATLGHLYAQGYEPAWHKLYTSGRHVSLPTYPWQRQRYWNEALNHAQARASFLTHRSDSVYHPLLGPRTPLALHPKMSSWTSEIDPERFPYLADHCVDHVPVLPCAAYLELALAAATEIFGAHRFCINSLELKQALFFPKGSTHTLQVIATPDEKNEDANFVLRFFSKPAEPSDTLWLNHATASISLDATVSDRKDITCPMPEQPEHGWMLALEAPAYYQGLRARSIQHGPLFQGVTHVWRRPNEVMCAISIPEGVADDMAHYQVHPALLDAFLQSMTPFLPQEQAEETYVPVAIKQVQYYQRPAPDARLWAHARVHIQTQRDQSVIEGDLMLFNARGELCLEVRGLRLQSLNSSTQDYLHQRLSRLLYTIDWEEKEWCNQKQDEPFRRNWLIFGTDPFGPYLAHLAYTQGIRCVLVMPDVAYHQLAPEERYELPDFWFPEENFEVPYPHLPVAQYTLPPDDPEAFRRLLSELVNADSEPFTDILYDWGGMMPELYEYDDDRNQRSNQDQANAGLLHLVQALAAAKQEARLWVVTNGVHIIEPGDPNDGLFQSTLWGLGRVIVYEHPDIHCTLVDMNCFSINHGAEVLLEEILCNSDDDEVALRPCGRYVARLVRSTLLQVQAGEQALFRSDGTYLITGGLGGVGLRMARWMIEQGARHLVLLGRHAPSEEVQTTLQAMRETGAEVCVMQVDVAQQAQLADALKHIRRTMPPLRGIFHAAVVLEDSILLQMNQSSFLNVIPPKIDGGWNLHLLTQDDPLDYFVLFSSAASLIGSPGQGNYAAANAFLDALAHRRQLQGRPALTINWGRWGEVGQALKDGRGAQLDARGFASIKPQEGLAVLGKLLQHDLPQIGVISFDLARWSQFYPKLTQSSLFARLLPEIAAEQGRVEQKSNVLTREILAALDEGQRQERLAQYLNDQIARVLGHTSLKLNAHQQLSRLGIDSLMSVQLKNRIEADINVVVPVTAFLQGITFEQLIEQIVAHM